MLTESPSVGNDSYDLAEGADRLRSHQQPTEVLSESRTIRMPSNGQCMRGVSRIPGVKSKNGGFSFGQKICIFCGVSQKYKRESLEPTIPL